MRETRMVRAGRRAVAVLGLSAIVTAGGLPATAMQVGGVDGIIAEIGTLERLPADAIRALGPRIVPNPELDSRKLTSGTLVVLPEVRQLWQVYPYNQSSSSPSGTALTIRSLDTLRLVRTVDLPNLRLERATNTPGGEWIYAVESGRRIFFLTAERGVVEIDLRTFQHKTYPLLDASSTFPTFAPSAFQYDRQTGSLIALYSGLSSSGATHTAAMLAGLDVTTMARKVRLLRSCTGPQPPAEISRLYDVQMLLEQPGFVFVPCERAGYIGAVVRIPRAGLFDPTSAEDVVIGPVQTATSLADEGSGRIFQMTEKGEIWVFDSRTLSYLGLVSASADRGAGVDIGYGLDPATGRLFFQSPTFGFGVVEGRFFPVPQALTLPHKNSPGRERIYSDAKTRRVFVLEGIDGRPQYVIYRVSPAPPPPRSPDPDSNTVDRPEKDGVTQADYSVKGSGYGVRIIIANGVSTIVPAPAVGTVSPTAEVFAKNGNSRCGFTDRELLAARVTSAEYSTGSARAVSTPAAIDNNTKIDVEQPSRCDLVVKNNKDEVVSEVFGTSFDDTDDTSNRFDVVPAECNWSPGYAEPADGKDTAEDHGQTKPVPLGTGRVACPTDTGKPLEAYAEARLTGSLAVQHAETKVDVTRDAAGVHTTVTSVAQGIDIAGQIQIGRIEAKSTSTSNGRPNEKPQSTYTSVISGVVVAGQTICASNAACPPAAVVDALNQAGAGRVQFRFASGIDGQLLQGSDGGAQTAVQKSEQRQASDKSLIGDTTLEVPALEMIVYNDNSSWGRARQLFQFAGVTSAATYNITLLPTGEGLGPEILPPAPDLPPVTGPAAGAPTGNGPTVAAPADDNPGPVTAIVRAVARGLRLLLSDPRQAMLLFTAWLLFAVPVVLGRRRRRLLYAVAP